VVGTGVWLGRGKAWRKTSVDLKLATEDTYSRAVTGEEVDLGVEVQTNHANLSESVASQGTPREDPAPFVAYPFSRLHDGNGGSTDRSKRQAPPDLTITSTVDC